MMRAWKPAKFKNTRGAGIGCACANCASTNAREHMRPVQYDDVCAVCGGFLYNLRAVVWDDEWALPDVDAGDFTYAPTGHRVTSRRHFKAVVENLKARGVRTVKAGITREQDVFIIATPTVLLRFALHESAARAKEVWWAAYAYASPDERLKREFRKILKKRVDVEHVVP